MGTASAQAEYLADIWRDLTGRHTRWLFDDFPFAQIAITSLHTKQENSIRRGYFKQCNFRAVGIYENKSRPAAWNSRQVRRRKAASISVLECDDILEAERKSRGC
jgi:hypothetical protein